MEVTDGTRPVPDSEGNQPPWVREPKPMEVPKQETAGGHDEPPIEEPGYGHGV